MDIKTPPSKKKMRIKTGMEVEAWITDAATNNGAWRAGEVIEGDGHSYKIRWFDGGLNPARIFRRFVRPSPPPDVKLPKDVAPGDIVELLDCNLWKSVEVARVGDDQFDVRFFGNTNILTVDVSVLRPQLMYGEEGWFLIHKVTSPPSSPHAHPLGFCRVCRTNGLALFLLRCRINESPSRAPHHRALSPLKTSRAKPLAMGLAMAVSTSPRMLSSLA
jgi:hypothetical protein